MNYVAYYRVSTNKQNLGLDAQRQSVINYINSNTGCVLISEFEEKESGKNDNRTQLYKAISYCKQTNSKLIIAKLDRLSRKVSFIFALRDSGVDFIALDIPNFSTLTLGIFATLAQTERELISMRTKAALAVLKDNGIKLGAPNPTFSFETRTKAYSTHHSNAKDNPNNQRAYSFICELLRSSNNLSYIARRLNECGFVTSKGCIFHRNQVVNLINLYK